MSDLDELRRLAEAATPGPWAPYFSTHGDPFVIPASNHAPLMCRIADVSTSPDDYGRANAEFIGGFGPDRALTLLAEVAALREQVAAVRAALNECWSERQAVELIEAALGGEPTAALDGAAQTPHDREGT